MTNEKLYEVLGDINEKYVNEAREYRKAKKPVWVKWGAMSACLCLVVVGALVVPSLINNTPVGDIDTPPIVADIAPMVCINGELYRDASTQISYTELNEETADLGKIESEISNSCGVSDGIPKEDFQANHSIVGSEVYQYGNDIVIKINGKYWLYTYFEI